MGRYMEKEKFDKAVGLLVYYGKTDTDGLRRRVNATIARNRRKKLRLRMMASAAAILLLVVAGGVWLQTGRKNGDAIVRVSDDVVLTLPDGSQVILGHSAGTELIAEQDNVAIIHDGGRLLCKRSEEDATTQATIFNNVTVPKGSRFDIVLEDGTRVWLNADSRLRFPTGFAGGERRVYLEGEAYFDVTQDVARPFVVETPQQTLQVLGTEFNIYAYPDEAVIYTTLVTGSVALSSKATGAETKLEPGHQARLSDGGYSVGRVNVDEVSAWREGMFVFDGNTLELVFRKLSHWYDFEYSFDDARTSALLLVGEMPMYDDIERILKLIESSGQVDIERKGKKIHVRMKR